MPQKIYLNILKIGIYASLITVFFVFKDLLFPFITSKQISFNILIESLFILWFAFIIKYPEYRPKKSYVSFGLLAFFAAMIISCFTGVDFNLSFWGDIERMLGVFHLLHFLAFYFIIISVMRSWRDWQIFFITSIIFAVFVSIKGLGENAKSYSTIGNTAYVSGYLIFNIYFAIILFFKERASGWKWLYLIPIPFMFAEFQNANTTGALVGLGFSIMAILFLYGVLAKNKKIKISTITLLLISVGLVGWVFTHKDSDFVANTPMVRNIIGIDIQKNTFQTRLISWRAALKDFKTHLILGTGHGNYAIIFDKYFEPTFYDHTRSETYFDRAHNNVIDIASTTGLAGLLTYLSIFAAAAYYLISGYRRRTIDQHEFILISGLIIAYFVQNLAVFDSLVTYIGMMMILGYIYWLSNKDKQEQEEAPDDRPLINKEIYALVGAGIILLTVMYQFNIKPLKMLVGTIDGQRALSQGNLEKTVEIYKQALSYNTVLDRDSRTSLNRSFAGGPGGLKNMDKAKAQEILDFNIKIAKANVDYNPGDSLNQMMLAQILNTTAIFNNSNPEKFSHYSDRALEAINKSIASSPGRVPIYFQKAQILVNRGEKEKVIETLKYAVSLNEKYYDSSCQLSRTLFFYKNEADAYKYMDQCLDYGGQSLLSPAGFVKSLINYYSSPEDLKRRIALFERLIQLEANNYKNFIELTKLYVAAGEEAPDSEEAEKYKEKARKTAAKAGEIDPSIKEYTDEFIQDL